MSLTTLPTKALTPLLTLFNNHRTLITGSAVCVAAVFGLSVLSDLIEDYNEWYELGPNGIPLNFFGYIAQKLATPLARTDVRDPIGPYDLAKMSKLYGPIVLTPFLDDMYHDVGEDGEAGLRRRPGERPVVPGYVGPHRQTTQKAPAAIRAKQDAFLHDLAAANPALFEVKPSSLEGPYFNAIWIKDSVPQRDEIKHLHGEFAHPHGEGSTHLVLSLADAATAIEACWAERHRMSGVGNLIPWGFVMIYAPRDDDELEVWKMFIVVSARYALGGETEVKMPSPASPKSSKKN
ncbi:uncharacterized protein GGS22DRAFT_192893 [Annulohypoxylon maeteangense]|uniref:uncharacterized protein n=1 Tax=Annulohypoxylon maeteangense TaxID=1927788 RepID=UPI0020081639|nr:uncharacterized protein GGS22DRAFT_192893 [Annulohypoxylon maeteangense]KAI0880758.1 hypothetical protein GGS22DRAFT_192893 [Annulohypoxylon maeteangense]